MKNDLVVGLEDRHIKHLSETQPGRVSDIKIAVQEALGYPQDTHLYQDKGFQGYAPSGVIVHQPKKKPKGGDLTQTAKPPPMAVRKTKALPFTALP